MALVLKMWGLLEEVTFEPRSLRVGKGQGESLGEAFQAERRTWAKVLWFEPAWYWKNSMETGVALLE